MRTIQRTLPWLLILTAPMVMLYPLWSDPVSAGEDDVVYYYPLRKLVAAQLLEGRWGTHTPLEATGAPLMGDPQSGVMFPATWLFVVLDPKLAYSLSIFLAFSIAGMGTYLYLRSIGLVVSGATFGAVGVMFSGFMVGHRVHLSMIQTACFAPWGLWCIEVLRTRRRRGFACMVPVVFLSIAGGHWAILTYVGILWGGYLLVRGRPLIRSIPVALGAGLLGATLAGPQLFATWEVMSQSTRNGISYAELTENSFHPLSLVLAFFPMLLGSRTPNFFPDRWWGVWHLSEMLGYVGLVTLIFAGVAVWRLYRRGEKGQECASPSGGLSAIVKFWTWAAVLGGFWMFGKYIPSYRLVHLVPVLNVARCPARMVLVVDIALAVLAGIAIHALAATDDPPDKLRRTIRRAASICLPLLMLTVLGLMVLAGWVVMRFASGIAGGGDALAKNALNSVRLTNPAVWVPLGIMVATGVVVHLWLRRPQPGAWVLIVLLLVDLFFITRFVDVPCGSQPRVDPDISPAADWLRERGPGDEHYRIWSLSDSYHERPTELLLPKTAHTFGFATLGSYGPWHHPDHAHLLGFNHYGRSSEWARLLRTNYLLGLYNVRFILAADEKYRDVIESVRIPTAASEPDGPNLLSDDWTCKRADFRDGIVRIGTPQIRLVSFVSQTVPLKVGQIYRITLDARCLSGVMGNIVRSQVCGYWEGYSEDDEKALELHTEQVGEDWRHFELTFRADKELAEGATFVMSTVSDKIIEIRNAELHKSHWERSVAAEGVLEPGERVYRKVAELGALNPQDPPVVVYENRCALPVAVGGRVSSAEIEALRFAKSLSENSLPSVAPDIAFSVNTNSSSVLVTCTVPAGLICLLVVIVPWSRIVRKR